MIVDVVAQLHDRDASGFELCRADDALEQLRARVSPSHELLDVVVGHSDEPPHDHHRKSVGYRTHPLDSTAAGVFVPEPLRGRLDERLELPDATGCQLGQQQLAMGGMDGVISGGQGVRLTAEALHLERFDRAVGVQRHRCGEIRREHVVP